MPGPTIKQRTLKEFIAFIKSKYDQDCVLVSSKTNSRYIRLTLAVLGKGCDGCLFGVYASNRGSCPTNYRVSDAGYPWSNNKRGKSATHKYLTNEQAIRIQEINNMVENHETKENQ